MTHTSRSRALGFCLVGLAAILTFSATVQASTVTPMTVPTLADHAGQVVVGRVAAVRSYWADNPKRIESEITLEQVDYLKGRLADATDRFSLIVPGGEIDGMRMTVCCAPDLRVGERWLLFLLPAYHTYPVVGIYRGAFLIETDAEGVERVVSRRHGQASKVLGVGSDGFVQVEHGQAADVHEHLQAAENVRLIEANPAAAPTIKYADFVAQLAPLLAASRDHQLTAPAGRPAIVKYKAVPLKFSPMEQQRQAEKGSVGADGRLGSRPLPDAARRIPDLQPATQGQEVPR